MLYDDFSGRQDRLRHDGTASGVDEYYPLLGELKLQSAVSGKTTARLELAEAGEFVPKENSPVGRDVVSNKTESAGGYDTL